MDVKIHYEEYWSRKSKHEEFWIYERNWVLSKLFPRSGKVLDVGCGDGAVAEYLKEELNLEVIGYDISEKAAREAKKRGIQVVVGNVEVGLPFKESEFDVVFWGDTVEHLFDPRKTLGEIRRVLKKEGKLILSCPNMAYWRYRLYYLMHGCLPDTEWSGNPPWCWSHIRFFNKQILDEFLKTENLLLSKVHGVNRRFPDRYLAKLIPSLFGMILVAEVQKR